MGNSAEKKGKNVAEEVAKETKAEVIDKLEQKIDPELKNVIKIFVIQAKNLPSGDPSGSSDPYVVVKFRNSKNEKVDANDFRTRVIPRNKRPVWNDDFVLEKKGLIDIVDRVIFEVFDKDRLSKDDLLGRYEYPIKGAWDLPQHPQWVNLKDDKGNEGKFGQLQVQVLCLKSADRVTQKSFSHVLALTISKGENLRNMDWIGRSDPLVEVGWGSQMFKTSTASNTDTPTWNETTFLFVDREKQSTYVMRFSVADSDIGENDLIGVGFLQAKDIFEAKNETNELSVPLTKNQIRNDAQLRKVSEDELKQSECGTLKIKTRLYLKDAIQHDFFEYLIREFDTDKDKTLSKTEVEAMFALLNIGDNADAFFDKYDKNGDGTLEAKEVMNMLATADFQESQWMPQLMVDFLKQQGDENVIDSHLMAGLTKEYRTTGRDVIFVKDRSTGLLVQENIPHYIMFSLRLMYNTKTGRLFSGAAKTILKKMSRDKGKEYDEPQSTLQIDSFITLHNLDMSVVPIPKDQFKTFNDFFARPIKPEARPIKSKDENVILSPADCRMMVFGNIYESNMWIKGAHFTLENVLGPRKDLASKLDSGAFCIARLAPQDYHRFHWPVSGKVLQITPIDGALYTVNPIAVNQVIDVYTENTRVIVEIDTGNRFGTVLLIAVGATMVGSYRLFSQDGNKSLEIGDAIHRGDVAGEFRFGGSTVLVAFEPNRIVFNPDLLENTKNKIETLVRVRDDIGKKI